ncbi:IucA/IucC family protein [Catenuloplanes atrovinosus]|uniref:Siderophore synthetase component n=1 Tax=Catenuloplanes atrovinosus TaxID=137266 RepID=A0AAE4CBT8_9ACTN|nr:IucA/IucC family protein [Catenuloplanes atrovinosus]MDR7275910.1 siderophore synthetase component [Catenuloplanes atrovinosus]
MTTAQRGHHLCALAPVTLTDAIAHTTAGLTAAAPALLPAFRDAIPEAARTVGTRLLGALIREDIGDARARHAGRGTRHGFDRVEPDPADVPDDPVALLPQALLDTGAWALAAELADATANLAVAFARPRAVIRPADADETALAHERLAITGHNLHPCGRTRLGWDVPDLLAHDLETPGTALRFVAVRRDRLTGEVTHPGFPDAPPGYATQPVHAWQWDAIVRHRHARLLDDDTLRPLDGEIPVAPTAALRTVLLPPAPGGTRHYLKVSLDILVTSTRRSISVASTQNGPALSRLLHTLVADDPDGHRLLLLAETAGAAVPAAGRDLAAILRDGIHGRLTDGETVVPGSALAATDPDTGRTVLAGLADAYPGSALDFVEDYARLLLPPLLRLAARHGIALEAHLQNCLPTFRHGRPHRLVLRDFAGLRLHRPRLAASGIDLPLWPGSVTATDDAGTMRAKIGYTALQAHLGEIIVQLTRSHALDEPAAWRRVRAVVDETYDGLRRGPRPVPAATDDHAWLTAPLVPHKALVRMRLAGSGDVHHPVRNPLHDAR